MKPPEKAAREMAGEWLAKADADLRARDGLLAAAALSEIAAFHAQQAAEKALKAFLVWNQVEFPRTHDIKRLLALCRSTDPGLAQYCSFKGNDHDPDLHPRQRRCAAGPQREVAHLALHAARVAAAPAAGDALLEDLVEHALMKGRPLLRGE